MARVYCEEMEPEKLDAQCAPHAHAHTLEVLQQWHALLRDVRGAKESAPFALLPTTSEPHFMT